MSVARRRHGPGPAGRWALLVSLLLVLGWLLLQPRIERLDGQVLLSINGAPVDAVGAIREGWWRMVSDCARVRDRTTEPALNREVLESLRGYSPPDSLSARVSSIHSVGDWLLVQAAFETMPPVRVVMRRRGEGTAPTIEAVWSGSTYPWRTVPFSARFLQARVPEAPEALVRCVR